MFYKLIKKLNLKLFYVYLAGAIEADKTDGGAKWRDAITPALDNAGIYVQDPVKTEPLVTEMTVVEAQEKFNAWIASGHYDKFAKTFEKVVQKDIRMVHRSDFVIVHLFPDIPTTGTIHEMAETWRLKKPIYLIWTEAISKLPKWALYLCTSSGGQVFPNKKQCADYITLVYDLKKQSLRIQIIQFFKALFRMMEEKRYCNKLNKIKESLQELSSQKEKPKTEIKTEESKKEGE